MCLSYLYGISMLTQLDHSRATQQVSSNFFSVLIVNYMFWPFVNFLNFRYIPLKFRILGMNLCSIVWNSFLAWYYHKNV